jgi:hypothetical protein
LTVARRRGRAQHVHRHGACHKEYDMADPRPDTTPVETQRIDMLRDADVHFWCRTFDVSPAQLRAAVQHVGPRADAVRRELQRTSERAR